MALWLEKIIHQRSNLNDLFESGLFGLRQLWHRSRGTKIFRPSSPLSHAPPIGSHCRPVESALSAQPLRNPQGVKTSAGRIVQHGGRWTYYQKSAPPRAANHLSGSHLLRRARQSRYFADWIMEQLPGFIGPGAGDVVVRTTLDAQDTEPGRNPSRGRTEAPRPP